MKEVNAEIRKQRNKSAINFREEGKRKTWAVRVGYIPVYFTKRVK